MPTEKQQLPKLELLQNQIYNLKLLRDKPYAGTSRFGKYFLYTVSHQGEEKSFFASEELHDQIQSNQLSTGSEIILRTTPSTNGRRFDISFEVVHAETLPSNGHTDQFREIMQRSLTDALEIAKSMPGVPFQPEDLRSICSCLFIARTKAQYN